MYREYRPRAVELLKGVESRPPTNPKRKKTTDGIRYFSHYDALTRIPNRAFFRSKLRKAIRAAKESDQTLAVLFLSLDPYCRINETLGPAMGDRLVRCVARRLKEIRGRKDALGYWGSDEFAFLLEHPGDELQLVESVQSIKKAIERTFLSLDQELFLTSSIGIGRYPLHGLTTETLLRNARAALFQAKECGGNGYRFYSADLNARSLKRFSLENRLGQGLQKGEFTLHYQPQIDTSTWQITGAEALLRWQHPELGPTLPADFIPLAEKSGLIIPIGEWVLRAACLQLRHWHAEGFPKLSLAINVSARQFQEPAPADAIIKILKETGLDPGCLELELTESSLMANAAHVLESLRKLKDNGIKLAIDDFGAGFSSLDYLRRLPLDTLKIDQSFVRDASRVNGAALLSSITTLAHRLRLRVVAEGVETEEQLTFLQQLGCNNMQGYLFSKPLPGEQFKKLLAASEYQFKERNAFTHARAAS